MNAAILYTLGCVFSFALGYTLGKWNGYLDAQPKRDKSGRFTKEQ
jgi:hypothetical protein